jgi:hypothetical protein
MLITPGCSGYSRRRGRKEDVGPASPGVHTGLPAFAIFIPQCQSCSVFIIIRFRAV